MNQYSMSKRVLCSILLWHLHIVKTYRLSNNITTESYFSRLIAKMSLREIGIRCFFHSFYEKFNREKQLWCNLNLTNWRVNWSMGESTRDLFSNLLSSWNLVVYIYVSKTDQLHKCTCDKTGYKLTINNAMFQKFRLMQICYSQNNDVKKPAYVY